MAWINIIVDGYGDKVTEINEVRLATDEDGKTLLFNNSEEADNWCWENNEPGLTYSTIEVWS